MKNLERKRLVDEANTILKKAENEKRDTTPEESKKVDELIAKIEELDEEKRMNESINTPPLPDPGQWSSGNNGNGGAEKRVQPAQDKSYRGMFFREGKQPSNGGFRSMEEFFRLIHSERHDPRLEGRAMVEGIGSDGGFSVPDEFAGWLLDKSLESEIVRPRAQVWPMISDTRKIPAWDGSDHSSNLFGGFVGYWLAEAGTATRTYGKLRQVVLNAKKLACFTQTSNEVIADGMSFEQQLGEKLIQCIGWYSDYAYLNGSGAGQLIGVLNSD